MTCKRVLDLDQIVLVRKHAPGTLDILECDSVRPWSTVLQSILVYQDILAHLTEISNRFRQVLVQAFESPWVGYRALGGVVGQRLIAHLDITIPQDYRDINQWDGETPAAKVH